MEQEEVMTLAGTIAALAALNVYQGFFNGFLICLVVMLVLHPERADSLRAWWARTVKRLGR
jgi:hypothetical protein